MRRAIEKVQMIQRDTKCAAFVLRGIMEGFTDQASLSQGLAV